MDSQALQDAGWKELPVDGYSASVGTIWTRGEGAELTLGFVADERLCNHRSDTVHGGALMTFADVALGYAVVCALGAPRCATAQLQMQFVAAGRMGVLLTCRPEIIRRTSQLVFVRGLIVADEQIIASADGMWKVFPRR